jgi:hypothetical protein
VTIAGFEHVQVVDYKVVGGQNRLDVIRSFGRYSFENEMNANRFASEYERLRREARLSGLKSDGSKDTKRQAASGDLVGSTLALFGIVLSATALITSQVVRAIDSGRKERSHPS